MQFSSFNRAQRIWQECASQVKRHSAGLLSGLTAGLQLTVLNFALNSIFSTDYETYFGGTSLTITALFPKMCVCMYVCVSCVYKPLRQTCVHLCMC